MKNKKKILIIIGILLLLLVVIGVVCFAHYSKETDQINSYLVQLDKKKITSNDSVGKKLNEKITIYQELNKNVEQVVDIEKIFQNPESVKNKIIENEPVWQESSIQLKDIQMDSMIKLFQENSKSRIAYIKKEYKESKFFDEVEDLTKKIIGEQQKYNKAKELSDYLINHQNEWKYFDSVVYFENEEVGKVLQDYKKELSLNQKIEKGVLSYTTANIPILMYHGVSDNVWGISSLFVSPKDFDEQMKYLSENGFTPIFMHEIEHLDPSIKKPIVITFDDGNYDVYHEAFPILKKYNIKATVFVISGFGDGVYSMTHEQVKEMSDSDLISIQSHTVTHKPLATLSLNDIEMQLKDSKETLEKLTGREIYTIAYPTGSYDKRVIEIAKKYYKYGLLAGGGTAYINQNMSYFEIKRIGIFRESSFNFFKSVCETASR